MPDYSATNLKTTVVNTLANSSSVTALTANTNALGDKISSVVNSAANGLTNLGTSILDNALTGISSNLNQYIAKTFQDINVGALGFSSTPSVTIDAELPLQNVLNYYTSYNYQFTLSVLDDASVNFPEATYRKGEYGPIILKSASAARESELVATASGKFDFFMDDLKLSGMIGLNQATGNSNATSLSFTVNEPYSMGLFFQAVQTAALQAGHANYVSVPLLLTIEFKGHIDPTLLNHQYTQITKHIPIRILSLEMRVTGKGCEYQITAVPWNEQGMSNTYGELKTDISIKGNTVQKMLQIGEDSLQAVLARRFQNIVDRKEVVVPDQILILFPKDSSTAATDAVNESSDKSATTSGASASSSDLQTKLKVQPGDNKTLVQKTDVNILGSADMGFTLDRKADTPFSNTTDVYDKDNGIFKRGNISIDPTNCEFKFNQGTSIQNVINQVLLMSEYGRNALKTANLTPDGRVAWWRIETHVYNIPSADNLTKTGTKPKLVVFRVLPYAVDASNFLPVNVKSDKVDTMKKEALKAYNYIYTGKNLDILDFSIEFNTGFYRAFNADNGANNISKKIQENTGTSQQGAPKDSAVPVGNATPVGLAQDVRRDQIKNSSSGGGGGGQADAASVAARQFHDIATQGHDMLNLNMKILGDPYYIVDSGMGNYTAGSTNYKFLTADGGINYQNGEVYIIVNFRTPVDINKTTGFYNFGDSTVTVSSFSGLFRVLGIESMFKDGRFTQQLQLVRWPGQDGAAGSQQLQVTPTTEYTVEDDTSGSEFGTQAQGGGI